MHGHKKLEDLPVRPKMFYYACGWNKICVRVCESQTLKTELQKTVRKEEGHGENYTQSTFIISILNIHILEESYEREFIGWSRRSARITERNARKILRCEMPLEWKDLRN
jgi:hypothetical protein